jgi:hypothetical protein
MARAPSNPQRNIECQELQELQEFRSCRNRKAAFKFVLGAPFGRILGVYKFQIYDPVTSTPIL